MVELTRRYRFSAAHRLHSEALSAEENARLYGKCNNPHGHGHNYALEVTVAGPIDPRTGMVCDLAFLDGLVRREVLDPFDEVNLNLDTENFRRLVPTTENLCLEIYRLLRPRLAGAGGLGRAFLKRVRLEETSSNFFEYEGDGAEPSPARR
jgi:6-pyruvoyltetrahydropterin/6-carboxytetrahydropterin synthase